MAKPPIQLKRSGTASATPSSLEHGELALNYADSKVFWKNASNTISSFTFQSYALASHTHAASDITSGTFAADRLPLATTGAAGAVIVGTGLGVSSGTVSVTYGTNSTSSCRGDDSRLSDTRTPTDGSVTTAKIANDAVTYAKLQNVSATDRLLGRSSAGAGDVEEVTCTAFGRSLIDDADAAAARSTLSVQPTASPAFTGTVLVGISSALNSSDGVQVAAANNPGVIIARTAAPSNTNSIAGINATAYDGSAYVAGATINFRAAENWSSTNHGTDIQFRTTPTGSGGSLTETLRLTAAGQLLVTAGSGSGPSSYKPGIAVSGDDDTGVQQIGGANTISVVTNGSERVRVDASGMVLCSSGFALQGESRPTSGAGLEVNYVSASNAATIGAYDRTGNVYKELHLFGSVIDFQIGAGSSMRLNAGGELLIGTTTDNGNFKLQVNSQIYATNATIATSDARFKTNVESLTDATAVIEALRPVAFNFLPHAERNFATERQVGLIAQEAQSALSGTDYADSVVAQCGDHLGLAYEKLVPVLIKALQESNARIAALEERINA